VLYSGWILIRHYLIVLLIERVDNVLTDRDRYRLWEEVQKATGDRGASLESALEVARRFWQQLEAVMATLADLQDALHAQPPPAAQPRAIQAQQVALQEIRHEIDHTKPEVPFRPHPHSLDAI
jgi:hypothetical protein